MNDIANKPLVAVVDDDPEQRRLLRRALEDSGYRVVEGTDGEAAVDLARNEALDAMLLDVRMPKQSGLEALPKIVEAHPQLVVILLTAYIDIKDAVAAIKSGALDYLEKPVDLDELVIAVDEALGRVRDGLPSSSQSVEWSDENIVAESPAMQALLRDAARVAPTDASVLILGESGVGKEVLARYIHRNSPRRDGPLVALNGAAVPENLVENELFGHEKGSFTGAVSQAAGRFEEADGGTLFLDEVGEMPLSVQPKLLRVLEERTVRRIGANRDVPVDVRIIAATNRSLEQDVSEGRFREDLMYRLNVIALRLPPLRQRRSDILPLADRFLAEEKMKGKRFSPAVQRLLMKYDWPGNVRELRNAVARAAIICRGSLILPDDLPESIREAPEAASTNGESSVLVGDMDEIQKRAILEALEKTGGNKSQAAKLLNISRRNLIYKLRSYGM